MFSQKSVFQHNNVTRMIMNHAPIGEYRLRFFPNKSFACPCDDHPIETRVHDIGSLGTLKGNLLKMLSCFLSSIQKRLASKKALHRFSFLNLVFYLV